MHGEDLTGLDLDLTGLFFNPSGPGFDYGNSTKIKIAAMKPFKLFCGLIWLALVLAGCKAISHTPPALVEPTVAAPTLPAPLEPATTALAPSATPGPVTLDNICTNTGETAVLQGILRLPAAVTCSVGLAPGWCAALLYDPFTDKAIRVDLTVSDGPDPAPDHMAALPKPYTYTDFKLGTSNGGLVGHGSLVSLTGQIAAARPGSAKEVACKLGEVQRVIALSELKPVGVEAQQVNLVEAVAGGLVAASGRGKGLEQVDLTLKSQVDTNLLVTIQAGTLLTALSGDVQDMVVRQAALAFLRPGSEVAIEVEVACASMPKKEPGSGDEFKVGQALAGEDLLKLLALPEFQFLPIRLRQFAVWTVTDNPRRDYYVGVSTSRGISEGPTVEEFEQVKDLLIKAGIDISQFNAFK